MGVASSAPAAIPCNLAVLAFQQHKGGQHCTAVHTGGSNGVTNCIIMAAPMMLMALTFTLPSKGMWTSSSASSSLLCRGVVDVSRRCSQALNMPLQLPSTASFRQRTCRSSRSLVIQRLSTSAMRRPPDKTALLQWPVGGHVAPQTRRT